MKRWVATMRGGVAPAALILACGGFAAMDTEASCGSANCFLITGTQEGVFAPGQVIADLSYRYIPQDRKHDGSSTTGEALVPKVDFANGVLELDHHREHRTINMLTQLDLNIGVTPRLTLGVAIPFSNRRLHEHDDEVGTPTEHFTSDDGSEGFGDVAFNAKLALLQSTKHSITAGAGVKFPTGEYKLRDSEGAINEPTIMPGTGSYDLLLSGHYVYQWRPHRLSGFLSAQGRVTSENDLDYQFGDTWIFNAGLAVRIADKLTLSGQLNSRYAGRDEFKGSGVPSTGGTFVYLTPGVQLESGDRTAFYAYLQLPVSQDVNEVNLVPEYALQLGVSYHVL